MSNQIANTQDILDIRDIIERIEELEDERDNFIANNEEMEMPPKWEDENEQDAEELQSLSDFVEEWKGCGGDEQWRGDWYPVTLIRDSYFTEYTKELLEDCGYIPEDFPSWIALDWEETADNVKVDYTSVEFDGVEYWGR